MRLSIGFISNAVLNPEKIPRYSAIFDVLQRSSKLKKQLRKAAFSFRCHGVLPTQNAYLCALVFTVFTSFSLAGTAAPAPSLNVDSPIQSAAQIDIAAQNAKVNLNAADAQTLRLNLFGIGAAKAKAIVAYRESNGPFMAVDELLEVKGIGKALMEKNRDRLEIK